MSALRLACTHGDAELVAELLLGGEDPCSRDANGLTALHYAVWNGHVDCVEYILANPMGHTPARTSCVGLQTKVGWSALHIAALGCLRPAEIAERLVAFGVDAGLRDESGFTALDVALQNGNQKVIDVLRKEADSDEQLKARILARRAVVHRRSTTANDEERTATTTYAQALDAARAFAKNYLEYIPIPRQLNIPEHVILDFARSNVKVGQRRGKHVIHNLLFAYEEAKAAAHRREQLMPVLQC